MRIDVAVHLGPIDRECLRSILDNRNILQTHVWCAPIVLATADGLGAVEIIRATSFSKAVAWG